MRRQSLALRLTPLIPWNRTFRFTGPCCDSMDVLVTLAPMVMLYNAARAGEPESTVPHKAVSFRDLNLNSAEGIEVLYKRIRSAAHEVCADPYRYDLSEFALRPCIADAMSRAIAQVNNPMLTSLYNEKTGKADKKVITLAQAPGDGS